MLRVNELRVGNIILYKRFGEGDGKIGQMKRGDFASFNDREYFPVPITDEWLQLFGFKKDMGGGGGMLEFDSGFICFYNMNKPLIAYTNEYVGGSSLPYSLKYVHQLQNLYYWLTGKEITDVQQIAF